MLQKKTTLQAASMLAEGATDEKLKSRYGTSVEEYMSREHAKNVREQITNLRKEFSKINKQKNSPITIDELSNFFTQTNVRKKKLKNIFNLILKNI